MDEDQNNTLEQLKTFLNSCTEEQLSTFIRNTTFENREFRPQKHIDALCTAFKSLAKNPPLNQDPPIPLHVGQSSIENRTFSFTFHSARRLKDAVKVLCLLSNLEGEDTAMIEVGLQRAVCFQITVRSSKVRSPVKVFDRFRTLGYLHLKACHMSNFQCKQPFERKFVSLHKIYDILKENGEDDAAITVYHVEGSQELSFLFGNANDAGPHTVRMVHDRQEIQRQHPEIQYICYAVLHTRWLKEIVPHMVTSTDKLPQLVTLQISEPDVKITIGTSFGDWCQNLKIPGSPNISPRQEFKASFKWNSCKALKSATSLARSCKVYFTRDDAVVFKFKVDQLGYVWMRQAAETTNYTCNPPH